MVTIETSENGATILEQTHYYKTSYDKLKEEYLNILKELGHRVVSIDDDYTEIYSELPHFEVIAKIIMQDPLETSIDFYINSDYLFRAGRKAYQFMLEVYTRLEKKFQFKGVSLHK